MRDVMPSQVVAAIDELFPHAKKGLTDGKVDASRSTQLRGILNLAEAIPGALLPTNSSDYSAFVLAKSTIEETLGQWQSRGAIGSMPPAGGADAVTTLRRTLAALPDEHPPATQTDLAFIKDEELREDISLDIGAAERSLQGSEWKLCMIMAGAVIEDLLHWKLGQCDPAALKGAPKAPRELLDSWSLASMIDVAEELGVLRDANNVSSARVAKDYRNLIHPGRRARRAERPTRARAHAAIGGMYGVIDELR